MISRREFAQLALTAGSLAAVKSATAAGDEAGGVQVGASTFSFRDLRRTPGRDNVRPVIAALRSAGVRQIELSAADVESPEPVSGLPKPQTGGAYGGMTVQLTQQELAMVRKANRDALREWRLKAKPEVFGAVRRQFDDAGISIYSYRVDFDGDCTDGEIAALFGQVKAMGLARVSTAANVSMAGRLGAVAQQSNVTVSFLNSGEAGSIAKAVAGADRLRLHLDIGNLTAANQPAVAFLQENHAAVSAVTIKDRTRDGGGNEEFGSGDTPIKPVLALLKEKRYGIPVFVSYEYLGLGTPEQEVKKCMAYVRGALA